MDETGNWGVLDSSYFIVRPIKESRPQGVACECLWCDVCVREIDWGINNNNRKITKLYFFFFGALRNGLIFFFG